jgi:hypothetical protein
VCRAKNPKVKVELPKGVKDFQFAGRLGEQDLAWSAVRIFSSAICVLRSPLLSLSIFPCLLCMSCLSVVFVLFFFCLVFAVVVLEQPNTPLDLNPYNVVPYAHHIGFYIYDKDMSEMIAESTFRNAKEVVSVFTVDTTKRNRVLVIPCTHSAGVEMPFTLHFYSDQNIKIA